MRYAFLSAVFSMILALQALAEIKFTPVPLPVAHLYDGGWEHFVGGGVASFDCSGDSLPELFVAGGENPARLFLNESKKGESINFALAGIPLITGVTGAYPLDIDSDGQSDLVILRVGPNMVWRGLGNCQFKDVTSAWGIDPSNAWTTAFSATWEEGHVFPTLAFGNYVDREDPEGPFEACDHNEIHRSGTELSYSKELLEPGFCALSMLFSDWNRTGVQDLRVSNDRHYYVRGGSEQMWAMPELTLRDGEGWEPISIWGMGIASQDITGDGRPEVVLTSMGDQLMQIASEEGYRAAPFEIGTYAQRPYVGDDGRPSTGWHAQFGDVDNDGLSDLFIAKGNVDQMPGLATRDPNNLLRQNADGTFEEVGDSAGLASVERARGAAVIDLNADGLLDIVVVNRRAPLEVFENVSGDTGAWLQVELRQHSPNIHAVSAWVEVRVAGKIQVQEVTVGGGHVSGQLAPLHFGLGVSENAELRVTWPGGAQSAWQKFDANQRVVVTR